MPKQAKELPAFQVKRLTRPGFHAVGGVAGLHLFIKPTGARSWVLRTTVGERRRDLGLGGYPDVTLEQARQRAREAKEQVRAGVDPTAARRAARAALKAADAKRLTFWEATKRYHSSLSQEFRSSRHVTNWLRQMELYVKPKLGAVLVDQIELAHITSVLEPIWQTHTNTASRVRQRIEAVLGWATVSGYRSGDNPARWKGNLAHVLPAPNKIAKVNHHPALHWQDMPAFMTKLRGHDSINARALEFLILTAARSGEVRQATWDEIDLERKVWTVPAERMKAGKVHRVPLSERAVALLEALPGLKGNPHVFPSAKKGRVIADVTLSAFCKALTADAVPHGFRSTFKDWCRNSTDYVDEVSELALAHVSTDATRAAYARDELLEKRRELMTDWAEYLTDRSEEHLHAAEGRA